MPMIWYKPRVRYVQDTRALKHWAGRPAGEEAPGVAYLATCPHCGRSEPVSYNHLRQYGTFQCPHCAAINQGPSLVPDPGTVYVFGKCYWTRIILN